MNTPTRAITPLRQRMLDDMRMRKLEAKTQAAYIRAVRKLAAFLERSPDTVSAEELRLFQLHLVDQGVSPITLNATITGLKFFFEVTLERAELLAKMSPVLVPQKLPVVLSREETARLIAAATNPKYQAALSIAYGTGLRASEIIGLKVSDIDSQRMTLRVQQGKGRKDRYAMLSPVLLERLRTWWRHAHAQGKMLPGDSRLVSLDEHGVTFRWKDYRAKGKTRHKTMTLQADEFMRRFLLHVLPGGLHRIRHYGLLANGSRKACLAQARTLLQVRAAATQAEAVTERDAVPPRFVCRHCGGPMVILEVFVRGQAIRAPPRQQGPP